MNTGSSVWLKENSSKTSQSVCKYDKERLNRFPTLSFQDQDECYTLSTTEASKFLILLFFQRV